MIYEVRLRDVSGKNITNFVTYVIADSDLQAIKLADDLAVELQADEIRSVVAKPRMVRNIIFENLELFKDSKPKIGTILKLLAEPFKSFKGAKTN